MGKVRIGIVKRTARRLITMYPDLFTEDFENFWDALLRREPINFGRWFTEPTPPGTVFADEIRY
jgi:hypothetical protein